MNYSAPGTPLPLHSLSSILYSKKKVRIDNLRERQAQLLSCLMPAVALFEILQKKKKNARDIPGGPVVKKSLSNAGDVVQKLRSHVKVKV